MARQVTLPAWKRRRYERLGIPLPPALGQRERKGPRVPDAPPHSEPSQPAAEHIAALAEEVLWQRALAQVRDALVTLQWASDGFYEDEAQVALDAVDWIE